MEIAYPSAVNGNGRGSLALNEAQRTEQVAHVRTVLVRSLTSEQFGGALRQASGGNQVSGKRRGHRD